MNKVTCYKVTCYSVFMGFSMRKDFKRWLTNQKKRTAKIKIWFTEDKSLVGSEFIITLNGPSKDIEEWDKKLDRYLAINDTEEEE